MASESFDWDGAIRAHNHRVILSLLALGLPLDQAEDVAHQAWLRLMEQHQKGRLERVQLPGLAVRQARFLALSAMSRGQLELSRFSFEEGRWSPLPSSEASPEARLLSKEELRRALDTLDGCSEKARAIFTHLYQGAPPPSHAEVADRVGLSVQRVRQILCEVRKRMRRALEGES